MARAEYAHGNALPHSVGYHAGVAAILMLHAGYALAVIADRVNECNPIERPFGLGQLMIDYDIDTLVANSGGLAESLQIAALRHGRSGFRDSGAYHDFIGERG